MSTGAGAILEERRDPWYPGGQRDATIWVEEFFRIYPDGCADADTMLGWFANAIETGVFVANREAIAGITADRLAEVLHDQLSHYQGHVNPQTETHRVQHEYDARAILTGLSASEPGDG